MDDTAKPKPVEKKPEAKELNESELEKATGGAVNAYLIIDGRPVHQHQKQTLFRTSPSIRDVLAVNRRRIGR